MAAKTPYQARQLSNLPARNLIINGNFDFWQRGSTFNSIASSTYSVDRFRWAKVATGALQNVTRSTDVPTVAQSGYSSRYSCLVTQTATTDAAIAATDLVSIHYLMEGFDYAAMHGSYARLQFWVKASITGNYPLSLTSDTGNRSYVTYYTVNAANTWELKTIDIPGDTSTVWTFDNGRGPRIEWSLMVGSTYQTATVNQWFTSGFFLAPSTVALVNVAGTSGATWQIAQVSLVPGQFNTETMVPFTRCGGSIQGELILCQRYYEKTYNIESDPNSASAAQALVAADKANTATTTEGVAIPFSVRKRAAPTITVYPPAGGSAGSFQWTTDNGAGTVSVATVSGATETRFTIGFTTASGLAANEAVMNKGHYTADAEL